MAVGIQVNYFFMSHLKSHGYLPRHDVVMDSKPGSQRQSGLPVKVPSAAQRTSGFIAMELSAHIMFPRVGAEPAGGNGISRVIPRPIRLAGQT